MPVQPQFPIGPLGQTASPDGNQLPAQIGGNARYVQCSPPRIECGRRLVDPSLLNSPETPLHRTSLTLTGLGFHPSVRRTLYGYSFAGYDDSPPLAQRENFHFPTSPAFGVTLEGRTRAEITPIRFLSPVGHSPIDLNTMNAGAHGRDEFLIVKEDFPALPRIPEGPYAEQNVRRELPRRPSAPHQQTEPSAAERTLQPDNFDLKSYMRQWTSNEFYEAYKALNFEDIVERSEKLHPLGECTMETVTKQLTVDELRIGVNLSNKCSLLHETEDLTAEQTSYRFVNGYKVPVLENDKCYTMPDAVKDKLRNPRFLFMDDLTLFFQFYFFTQDTLQLIAADALFQKNWRWNKKISRWCRLERGQTNGAVQVYEPATNKYQTLSLPYSALDFELLPPKIPPPMSRNANVNYE